MNCVLRSIVSGLSDENTWPHRSCVANGRRPAPQGQENLFHHNVAEPDRSRAQSAGGWEVMRMGGGWEAEKI